MRAWVAAALLVVALGGCADGRGASDGNLTVARQPAPRPNADPAAGKPAYVAAVDGWLVLLDASGRVERVGPKRGEGVTLCPGGRRIAIAESWRGQVEVFSMRLRRLHARRVPVAPVEGVACLDLRGSRTAVVTGSDRTAVKTLRVLSPGRRRVVLRTSGEIPRLHASGVYISDDHGVRRRALSDGRLLARLPQPAGVYDVIPSPDGRRWLMNVMPPDTRDRIYLADLESGVVQPLPFAGEQALGWVAHDRFAVIGDGIVRILDAHGAVVQVVERFPSYSALLAGDTIVTIGARSLFIVPPGADFPTKIGTVPSRDTFLLAALER